VVPRLVVIEALVLEVLRVIRDSSMTPLASLVVDLLTITPVRPSSAASGNTASSEDGSGDEGVTIHVDSPLVANGSSQSSPVKQEKD
jgi:hypothetical protein